MSEPNVTGSGSPLSVLTRKVGPLPGWAWIAVAIGGYAVYRMYQAKNNVNQNTNPSTTAIAGSAPVGADNTDPSLNGGGLGSGSLNTGTNLVTTTPVGPVTNAQWAAQAARLLIAAGGNPTDVNNALTAYVSQSHAGLTSSQRAIVNAAIAQLGPPPEGLLPITSAPVPAPKPAPPKFRTYTTRKGDTFQSISKHFFGSPTAASGRIRSANPGLSSYSVTQKLPAGKVLQIPVSVTYSTH